MSYASEESIRAAQYNAALEQMQPSVLYRPRLFVDGDCYCALYGENLHDGIAGFGKTAQEAMRDFDEGWVSSHPPKQAWVIRAKQVGG